MAESAPLYNLRIEIENQSRGTQGGSNSIKQSVGNGITIMASSGAMNVDAPSVTVVELNNSQVAGLFGYIGLLHEGIDTSAIETEVATIVAAS